MPIIFLVFDSLFTVSARLRFHVTLVLMPNELLLFKLDITELADYFHMSLFVVFLSF